MFLNRFNCFFIKTISNLVFLNSKIMHLKCILKPNYKTKNHKNLRITAFISAEVRNAHE